MSLVIEPVCSLKLCCCVLLGVAGLMAGCDSHPGPRSGKVEAVASKSFTNSIGMEMIYLSAGYYVSKCETRQDQYQQMMGTNPSFSKAVYYPVESVSASDVEEFCKRLTEHERQAGKLPPGFVYDLPSLDQWKQYFAHAPIKDSVSPYGENPYWNRDHPAAVGSGEVNRLGICDLVGNVEELMKDPYDPKNTPGYMMICGGSFARFRRDPYDYPLIPAGIANTGLGVGFRCVLRPE